MDAGDFTMTSLGKCSYEFLETFNIRDIGLGCISYSRSAMAALRNSGVKDDLTHHYAKNMADSGVKSFRPSNYITAAIRRVCICRHRISTK